MCRVYDVDAHDTVVTLDAVPPIDAGAPLPLVVADEHRVFLAYLVSEADPDRDGPEGVAVVEFGLPLATLFGPPNDEAFSGHPLAARGLSPYAAFRVLHSSWIRRLERMNRVHPEHAPERYDALTHWVFVFHDSTFECVAESLRVEVVPGPLTAVAAALAERLSAHER